jgi:N,N'-diacetyllegionaminate synthase
MSDKKVLIIAEAGVNHNGDIELAKKLIDKAVEAGVDIVKFQTFKAESLVTIDAQMAEYQKENTQKNQSQFELLKKLELTEEDFKTLQAYCNTKGIKFFSTGFDLESLEFLKTLKMGLWKAPSGEITNRPYLEFLGRQNEHVILSTGMAYMSEIQEAIDVLTGAGLKKELITILHCNTDYPTPFHDVNLRAMLTIKNDLNVNVGYSDHTDGIEVSVAAVALGAMVIEKHFTLDKKMDGPDHKASLNPEELKLLVNSIRNIEEALGSSEKKPSDGEFKNRAVARKSIVAKKNISAGEVFSNENITCKRPGTGISPMKLDSVIGSKAQKSFVKDELIEL